jgi:hypothetical protein
VKPSVAAAELLRLGGCAFPLEETKICGYWTDVCGAFPCDHGARFFARKTVTPSGCRNKFACGELGSFQRGDEIILRDKKGTALRAFQLLARLPNDLTIADRRIDHKAQRDQTEETGERLT